jgi:3-carboxy-cis,cis-muconate cycloisomerase
MTFSALDSALTGPLFATDAMRAVFSDSARIDAMLKVEVALARAEAAKGVVPKALAAALSRLTAADIDPGGLGAKTVDAGVPTIPFVKAVERKLPEKLRSDFHKGTTSQDILDTALVLQVADGLDLIADDLAAILAGLTRLARAHRKTPCAGRTYGQHAVPVTFGYVVASWLSGIAQVAVSLPRVRERMLVISLGGAAGTLSALGKHGPAVVDLAARELRLTAPALPWHATRARIAETGAWIAVLIGALAKMATDVAFLSSTETGEVSEPQAAARGGSSAMPHKRNPVAATIILAAHTAAPGHVVTLLNAMAATGQRPAGAWHGEWHSLPQLFGLASGALREARRLAEGVVVDKRRMRANLDLTRGLVFAEAAAAVLAPKLGRDAAVKLIQAAAEGARKSHTPLRTALQSDPKIPAEHRKSLDSAFELGTPIDAAAAMVDRVLSGIRPVAQALRRKR